MRHRIVYTRFDGGVSVTCPTDWIMHVLAHGQFWLGMPRGFVDAQIERQIARGVHPYAAVRYARAMVSGGLTTAEALEVIRDRDCGHLGTAHELWDVDDIPRDQWFRNAWVRSHNGGPIGIDLRKAKRIQYQRLTAAASKSRATIQLGRWRDRIRKAETSEDLRRLWPEGLT